MSAITFPASPALYDLFTAGSRQWQWNGSVWAAVPQAQSSLYGTTANRPTSVVYGTQYFDTTLGYTVIWNGSTWTAAIVADGSITPAKLASSIGVCRAWVSFNGTGTVAINCALNVSSITDNGTGEYAVNFTASLPDIYYCVGASAFSSTHVDRVASSATRSDRTVSSIRVETRELATYTLTDDSAVNMMVFR